MPDPDGAGVILYTADKVLLHKRDEHPSQFPNYWGVFGGQMEPQETPVAAAARELQEELGVRASTGQLEPLTCVRVVRGTERPIKHYFRKPLTWALADLRLGEGEGFALFSHAELDGLVLVCEDRLALEKHFQGPGFGYIEDCNRHE